METQEEDYIDEEMKRPPYLHVRCNPASSIAALANVVASRCSLVGLADPLVTC